MTTSDETKPSALSIDACLNTHCPWSGDPVSPDSLTIYRDQVVGFCNPECRDKFDRAQTAFNRLIGHD
ncbi:glutathione S-transferase [Rhodovibrio salinarum]|uniref:Glutathione S-transferase n=1 Tax=Rhodovibrio salinarum TaxID=1087 RepID=A0A934QLB9_9PROT|nr:glutathione S-transferase [Rhodovibrio salinarum]